MPALLKYLRVPLIVCVCSLASCRSTILHKDSVRESVTEPIVNSIDRLEINKLVDSTNLTMKKLSELIESTKESAELSKDTLKKLSEALTELNKLTNDVNDTLNKISPDIQDSVSNIKDITSKVNVLADDLNSSTKESVIWKIIPSLIIALGVLLSILLIKKKM